MDKKRALKKTPAPVTQGLPSIQVDAPGIVPGRDY
jgi:hypothetical protein